MRRSLKNLRNLWVVTRFRSIMDRLRIFTGIAVWLLLVSVAPVGAQYGDPAAREDEAIERQKILKAADHIELLLQQNQKMQQDIAKLQQQVSGLQEEKSALQKRLDDFEKNAVKERQALLKEVASLVANKSSGSSTAATSTVQQEKPSSQAKEQGYEYEVKAGDSLWAIAKAFQDAGVKVSVDEIRKANNMGKSQDLRVGQKLFVPKN